MGKLIRHDFHDYTRDDLVVIEYGEGLAGFVDVDMDWNLQERVDFVREMLSEEFNVNIPHIPLYENRNLHPNEYVFKIMDVQVDENEILTDYLLAIPTDDPEGPIAGIETFDPCYHFRSFWIVKEQRELAELMGYTVVNALEIIGTHLTEILRLYLPSLAKFIVKKYIVRPMTYKGIFWITDMDNIEDNKLIYRIPVDYMGNIDDSVDRTMLNSKNHDNYNHKKTWKSINTKETRQKSFDYYPRGRVEISNGKAIIYATPCICTEEVVDYIAKMFELTEENFIHTVRVVPDYSKHYQCHIDREDNESVLKVIWRDIHESADS